MLEQVTGNAQFDQKINNMMKSFEETQIHKEELQTQLDQIKIRVDKLKEEIEVYEGYEQIEKQKKTYERAFYFNKLMQNQSHLNNYL